MTIGVIAAETSLLVRFLVEIKGGSSSWHPESNHAPLSSPYLCAACPYSDRPVRLITGSAALLPEGMMVYKEPLVQRNGHRIYVRDHRDVTGPVSDSSRFDFRGAVARFGPKHRVEFVSWCSARRLQGTSRQPAVQYTEVISVPGSPRRARSPATATDLSDDLLFLVLPCSSPPPSDPPLLIPSAPSLSLHRCCDCRCNATRRLLDYLQPQLAGSHSRLKLLA
jgi:hypothetical protein